MNILRSGVSIAVMSVWVGAALLLATSVAPAAFDALPSRTMAGDVVGRVLPAVFLGGLVAGIVATLVAGPGSVARSVAGLAVAFACAFAQFGIAPRIAQVRAAIGGAVDALAPDDPRRIAFGRLHVYSVGWLGVALLAGFVFVMLSLLALRQRP